MFHDELDPAGSRDASTPRRTFLHGCGLALAGALGACAHADGERKRTRTAVSPAASAEQAVTPGEDLMQEHGVLRRILLIYDEVIRRIDERQAFDLGVVAGAAAIVRAFVEDYHEQSEENYIFPRFVQAGVQMDLIDTLRTQHRRGRELTDRIVHLSSSPATPEIAVPMRAYVLMYRHHACREDTVVYPAFRSLISADAYRALGEQFEQREHTRFGEHGFEDVVKEVARLETELGIDHLDAFTPKLG